MKYLNLILLIAGSLLTTQVVAQDFVYSPTNPAFGGHYLNYQWMLNSANAQNTYEQQEDRVTDPFARRNSLESFEQDLNRQILNRLSRQIVESQFGETSLDEGNYNIGSYEIQVTEETNGVSINIQDPGTGNSTDVFIPYY